MRTAMQRVLLVGLLSHAVAFSTFFLVLSGTIVNGTKQAPLFLAVSLVLAFIAQRNGRHESQVMRRQTILHGGIVLAAGLIGVVVVGTEHPFYPMMLMAVFGVLQVRRMMNMMTDQAYLRQGLLDSYGMDTKVLIGLALFTIIFQADFSWQTKMVPFFIAFLLLRMYAMSMASRLLKGATRGGGSKLEQVQGNLPLLFLIGAGFVMWTVSAFGAPVFHLITSLFGWILTPVFYVLGHFVEWLMQYINPQHVSDTQKLLEHMGEGMGKFDPGSRVDAANRYQSLGAWFPFVLIGAVALIVLWGYYKKKQAELKARVPEEVREVREFIRSGKAKKAARLQPFSTGTLTQMRKTYRKFLLGMQKAGHARKPGETPLDLAGRIAAASPGTQAAVQELTDYYMRERYGMKQVDDKQARADQLADELVSKDKSK